MAEGDDFRAYQTANDGGSALLGCGSLVLLIGFWLGPWMTLPVGAALLIFGVFLLARAKRLRP